MANYVVELTYENDFILASSGTQTNTIVNEQNKKVTTITANAVRDFAFVLSKKFNVISSKIDNTNVYYYYYDDEFAEKNLQAGVDAIKTFNTEKDVTFYTYANTCIKTNIISAMRQTFRMKNRILNNSCSLDKLIEDTNHSYYDVFRDESNEPNMILIKEEEKSELISSIKKKLSKGELVIFELKLNGLSNGEIADLLNKDKKYVENTMFRINKKYKEVYND
jgi:RNA polymerase sporulation-specific sigma factor